MIEPIVSAAGAGLLIGWIAVDSFTYRDTITPRSWGYAINLGMAFVAGMALMYAWWLSEGIGMPLLVMLIATPLGVSIGLSLDILIHSYWQSLVTGGFDDRRSSGGVGRTRKGQRRLRCAL